VVTLPENLFRSHAFLQTETDTLTLQVWWRNKEHCLSSVVSFDLSDRFKSRKRPEMLTFWLCRE